MTPDELRLHLKASFAETIVAVTNTSGALLAADPGRVSLFLPAVPGLEYTVSSVNPAILYQGITVGGQTVATIGPAAPGVLLTLAQNGPWIQQALFAIGQIAGPTNVSVITQTLSPVG